MEKIQLGILLEKEVYFPGQELEGKVVLTTDEELTISAINIRLHAYGDASWTSGDDPPRHHHPHIDYIDQTMCLIAPEQGQKDMSLKSGTQEHGFKFKLPKQLPSSYEGGIGRVRYRIIAHVSRIGAHDIRWKKVFTLSNQLDLNKLPDVKHNTIAEATKNLCCWCCTSGPVHATMVVKNRSSFVPGETILFSSEISNKSSRSLTKTDVKLKMVVHYVDMDSQQYGAELETCVLSQTQRGPVKAGDSATWNDGILHIPPVPPSSTHIFISIRYIVVMKVYFAGPATSLKLPAIEVVIGSIPLKEVAPNIPCVSFAPSTLGWFRRDDDDDAHTYGDVHFAPAYMYYKRDPISNFTVQG